MTTPIPRVEVAISEDLVYLNHAGICPLPRRTADAMRRAIGDAEHQGSLAAEAHADRIEEVRALGARLCGVDPTEIAFVKNTSEGLGFIANGLDWEPGDRVVVPGREFPSTLYPWLALEDRGVVVEQLEPVGDGWAVPLELFEDAFRRRPVKLVCTSWVRFGRGYRVDLLGLAALCREHGALLCVDAIQGLGAIPASFDEWGVDFAAADAHKWMLGPEGIGLLYVRGERQDLLRPLEPGWNSVAHRREWDNLDLVLDPTARRYEGGTPNVVGTLGLGASLELLLDAGIDRIWEHVDGLCARAVDGLTDAGVTVLTDRSAGPSGIVTFSVPGVDPAEGTVRLKALGFVPSGPRGGGIRISPHGYNTAEEIDALVGAVSELGQAAPTE